MSTTQIKEKLHQYIDQGDDRFINMVYAMAKAYITEDIELSEEHKKILDERLSEHHADPNSGSSWKEVKARIEKRL